jgi:hypothetical protein
MKLSCIWKLSSKTIKWLYQSCLLLRRKEPPPPSLTKKKWRPSTPSGQAMGKTPCQEEPTGESSPPPIAPAIPPEVTTDQECSADAAKRRATSRRTAIKQRKLEHQWLMHKAKLKPHGCLLSRTTKLPTL